jgi:hypothetical protein
VDQQVQEEQAEVEQLQYHLLEQQEQLIQVEVEEHLEDLQQLLELTAVQESLS